MTSNRARSAKAILEIVPPFQGLSVLIRFPRALPWVGKLLPLRGVGRMQRALLPDDPFLLYQTSSSLRISSRAGAEARMITARVRGAAVSRGHGRRLSRLFPEPLARPPDKGGRCL